MNARDREQFEEFMTSRWPGLVRLAFGLTGDRWLAEDLAQTALASAYASWWRVCRADDPDANVRRILINASKSRLRAALSPVTISGATTALPGYAGLVNPRTAKVEVALSDGIIPPARPVTIAGRAYLAFAIPPGCQVRQLKLFDSAGHVFATASVPLP